MIIHDERNPKAVALRGRLVDRLGADWVAPGNVRVVIGGDGFLLRTVRPQGWPEHPWLGLNAGTLGFLLNDVDDFDRVAEKLAAGRYVIHSFPVVLSTLHLTSGQVVQERALNDVYLERMSGQAARLRLSIDGHEVVERLVADGIIFSTALGSTAYTYSAGGQPMHPLLPVLQITPICPHQPRLPSFGLPCASLAMVEIEQPEFRPVRAVVDGRMMDDVLRVEAALSQDGVRLAYFEDHDFTARMLKKIVHP